MSNHIPRASIGLPVYNGERFLAAAIDSVLEQTFSDLELIISDNASTDKTAEICRQYVARDPRIRYYRKETNNGGPWNFNRVFQYARGEFFKWQAADDVCAPTLVERSVEMLDRNQTAVLCYPRTMVIDGRGNLRRRRGIRSFFLAVLQVPLPANNCAGDDGEHNNPLQQRAQMKAVGRHVRRQLQ